MKVIGKIALGVCALALCGGVFFSCSNAADGSSSNQTSVTGEQTQTQTQTGTEQTQTQTQTSEYTEVWTGTSELGWAKGDNNGEFISNDKMSSSAKGLRITYTTDSSENHCLKFLQGDTWADIVVSKVEGSGTLANSGADAGKAVWLWKSQTNTTVTIFWTSGSEDETKVLSKGIKVYGDGATLTKIELYTPASTTTGGQPQTQTQTGTEQTQTQTQTGTEQTQTQTGSEQTQTQTQDPGLLFESSEGWTKDWETKEFEAAKFANAVTGSQFKFTVRRNTDQYRTGTEGNYDYSNCYSLIQLLNGEDKLTGGTIEGGEIEAAGGNLKPAYLLANGDPDYDESNVHTMVYTPSAAEIDILKTKGVGVQAHGTRILKIEFVATPASN